MDRPFSGQMKTIFIRVEYYKPHMRKSFLDFDWPF